MQDKNKLPYIGENELKTQIRSGRLAPCYLIFGEEHYLIKNYIDKLLSVSSDQFPEFNASKFDGKVSMQEVYDAAQSFPMMSPKRIVTVCDYPFDKAAASENERLLQTIKDIPSTTVLVLWYETVEINPKKPGEKYSKLIKAVKDGGGEVCYLGRKDENEIVKILQNGAARRKCLMDMYTARYMIRTCSDDLNTLVNELEKLCIFVGDGGTITNETVDKVCSRSVEAGVYNLSKELLRGDLTAALRLLDDLLYMNTEVVYILNILSAAYIDMYRVFCARTKGKNKDAVAKEFGYGNTAFRLNDAERNMRRFSEKQLVRFLEILEECELLVKESRVNDRVALEKALISLSAVAGGKDL